MPPPGPSLSTTAPVMEVIVPLANITCFPGEKGEDLWRQPPQPPTSTLSSAANRVPPLTGPHRVDSPQLRLREIKSCFKGARIVAEQIDEARSAGGVEAKHLGSGCKVKMGCTHILWQLRWNHNAAGAALRINV